MIILNKKKMLYILGIIAMFMFIYSMTSYNVKNSNQGKVKTIQTVALPVNNKIIVLDAGHRKAR